VQGNSSSKNTLILPLYQLFDQVFHDSRSDQYKEQFIATTFDTYIKTNTNKNKTANELAPVLIKDLKSSESEMSKAFLASLSALLCHAPYSPHYSLNSSNFDTLLLEVAHKFIIDNMEKLLGNKNSIENIERLASHGKDQSRELDL
jgi:hypothetical protein